MRLTQSTDFDILQALDETGRNVASNLQHHIEPNREYINIQLRKLEDYGLVKRIGPSERSGLYEITELGRLAIKYREEYDDVEDFEEFLKSKM